MFTLKVYVLVKRVVHTVELTSRARRQLRQVPRHIVMKLMGWIEAVQTEGLESVRRIPGYHDEPLEGARKGQRSIRLSRAYRAIYVIRERRAVELASVEEVHKHDY